MFTVPKRDLVFKKKHENSCRLNYFPPYSVISGKSDSISVSKLHIGSTEIILPQVIIKRPHTFKGSSEEDKE